MFGTSYGRIGEFDKTNLPGPVSPRPPAELD